MKKWFIIFSFVLFILCGCGKRESSKNLLSTTTTSVITTTSQTTTTISTSSKKTTTTKNKKTTKACTSMKFNDTYHYVYKTFLQCKKQGKEAFLEVSNHLDNVLSYGCEEIVDDCNDKWYSLYFYVYNRETDQEKMVHY